MKKILTAGLLVWIPLAITVWILNSIVELSDHLVALLPAQWQPSANLGFNIPGFGLAIAFVVVLLTGLVAANFFGQKLVQWWEKLLSSIPVVRPIYSGVKQIADTLLSQNATSFKEVVLVEFPQPEQWTLGFIVSTPSPLVTETLNETADAGNWVTVYVPTAPNPTSGYVIIVQEFKVRRVDISVDEAFKFHVSLGVLMPGEIKKSVSKRPISSKQPPEALN